MRAAPSGIAAHIQLGQTTECRLLTVQRLADGQFFGFTDHDVDIVLTPASGQLGAGNSITYLSTTSFNPFNQADKNTAEASDTELTGAFDSVILRTDVIAGLWDGAAFQLLRVNWANLSDGAIILITGSFGDFEPQEFGFRVSLHGLEYPLTFIGGEICGPTCRVDFGSPLCAPSGALADGTTINSLLQADAVASTDGITIIVGTTLADPGKPVDGGLLTFTGGANNHRSAEILHVDFATKTITLRPWTQIAPIAPGDTFSIFPACDKTEATCKIWNNVVNMQAEPMAQPTNPLFYPDYVAPHG